MIIDLILDRKDNDKAGTHNYDAYNFYREMLAYGSHGDAIAKAMNYGTEKDVKKALKNCVDEEDYNQTIKDYIDSKTWLEADN